MEDLNKRLAGSKVEMRGGASASERESLGNVVKGVTGEQITKKNEGSFSRLLNQGLVLGMAALIAVSSVNLGLSALDKAQEGYIQGQEIVRTVGREMNYAMHQLSNDLMPHSDQDQAKMASIDVSGMSQSDWHASKAELFKALISMSQDYKNQDELIKPPTQAQWEYFNEMTSASKSRLSDDDFASMSLSSEFSEFEPGEVAEIFVTANHYLYGQESQSEAVNQMIDSNLAEHLHHVKFRQDIGYSFDLQSYREHTESIGGKIDASQSKGLR